MGRKAVAATVLLPLLLLLWQGCGGQDESPAAPEESSSAAETKPPSLAAGFGRVERGMSQAQVRDWFGEPDEAGEEVNGTECWYYEEGVPGAGLNTYQFCFENGLLTRKNSDY